MLKTSQWATIATLCGALLCVGNAAHAQQTNTVQTQTPVPSKEANDTFEVLVDAIKNNSYADFVAVGDDTFKAALTQDQFAGVVTQFSPLLKGGYEAKFFGDMNKKGFVVSLWRLRFKAGGDDLLVEMSMKNGQVGGFFLR